MFTCQHEDCGPYNSYIGMTSTRLSRRLTYHLQNGAPKQHYNSAHKCTLTRSQLEQGTSILTREMDVRRLMILEALLIKEKCPTINLQTDDLHALPSARPVSAYRNRTANTKSDHPTECRERPAHGAPRATSLQHTTVT